ncbi:MAG: hypothetical protein HYZ81_13655 [Nitrospinae bacterium]|nr:hypothetical protein [Nitrospinota bacterium]
MAHAYTPGLRVTARTIVRKRRVLPLPGQVLVQVGERVEATTVVARAELPGKVHTLNVINTLGLDPSELPSYMRKRVGDSVEAGEPIAESRPLIKWFKRHVPSPVRGTVESISDVTGQVLLREPPQPLELRAYIEGEVVEVMAREGVVIETAGALLQGIFGVGGETWGELMPAVGSPEEVLAADQVLPSQQGKILVGGSFADRDVFDRARATGVKGIVVGGIDDADLRGLLGYDLGVAITGTEQLGFSLIVTEGFGQIAMAKRTFELLVSHAGHQASISGATQIRAGVMRPEIIIPAPPGQEMTQAAMPGWERGGLQVGDLIRLIRKPYFGELGRVKALPNELQAIATEARVRVLEVEFPDGTIVTVPRANVELIEQA